MFCNYTDARPILCTAYIALLHFTLYTVTPLFQNIYTVILSADSYTLHYTTSLHFVNTSLHTHSVHNFKSTLPTTSPLDMSGTQQTPQPTIGVDVFKDLINQTINQMKTELKSDLGTKLSNLDSTMGTKFNTLST